VGKTTVVGELVARALKAGLKLMLAAPTGRAAKRMSEATGCAAKTIHRLLMYDPGTNQFSFNGGNQLECDLLIVDECSMLDIVIADALFDAVPPGCSVVLVGDADQLPSVGPGRVLNDLMESKLFPVSQLTQVFRQAAGSLIIANAHLVNRGMLPRTAPQGQENTDFYWIEQPDPEKAVNMISRMVSERIPARFGFNAMTEVQVLSPMNRGAGGTENLNMILAQCLNPDAGAQVKVGERIFRKGDKVMQIANNYDKAVFNGDFGKIVYADPEKRRLSVQFDGERFLEYTPDELEQLSLAYAVTIHKSQGSEFPAVIVPLLNQHFVMLQRNLLYTAMTRAKKLLILIGSRKALELAVANIRQEPRWSLLFERLQVENG
jgi:exodeoxyribonuclease V alpha subunit